MLSVFQAWVVECQWLHTHCTLLGCRDFSHTVPAKEETEAGERKPLLQAMWLGVGIQAEPVKVPLRGNGWDPGLASIALDL